VLPTMGFALGDVVVDGRDGDVEDDHAGSIAPALTIDVHGPSR
jgi:hypothetical protein